MNLLVVLLMFMQAEVAGPILLIRGGHMLDVESGQLVQRPVIVVRGGRIAAVGTTDSIAVPENAQIIDLSDSTILPGLIDAHVHLAWQGSDQETVPGVEEARKTLLAGFTTVRNLGSTGKADFELRRAIESGDAIGPRMLISGPALGAKGGVCDQVFAGEAVVESPPEAAKKVADLIDQGADVIKLCAGGKVIPTRADENATELDPSILQAVVQEAHKRNRKVAAHAQGPAAILMAVRAGVDSIEHGGLINDEAAALMKKNDVFLVPTLYRLQWIVQSAEQSGTDAERMEKLRKNAAEIQAQVRGAIQSGVRVALGTDATVIPHGLNAREFVALSQAGLSPLETIRSATVHAAQLLGLKDEVGAIKPGMAADLIAVKGNPLENLKVLQEVHFVMKNGRSYDKEASND